jgi:hypothetical protein
VFLFVWESGAGIVIQYQANAAVKKDEQPVKRRRCQGPDG